MQQITKATVPLLAVFISFALAAQNVAISIDGSEPDESAILDLQSNTKGFLAPRMTQDDRLQIPYPATGLLVYQVGHDNGFYYFDGDGWTMLNVADNSVHYVTDVDGNVYPVVRIGAQHWMAENLRVTHFRNGDPIPHVGENYQWSILSSPAVTAYNDMACVYAPVFGMLYNSFAVNDTRGICPDGWTIPDAAKWQQLADWINNEGDGGSMKTVPLWHPPNTNATNSTGFSALPAGYRDENGQYLMLYAAGLFWMAQDEPSPEMPATWLTNTSGTLYNDNRPAREGLSVRCVLVEK